MIHEVPHAVKVPTMSIPRQLVGIAMSLLVLSLTEQLVAQQIVVTLPPEADTFADEGRPDQTNGDSPRLRVGLPGDRIDGKLGDHTRQAVRKFWGSAKQPVVEVNITDELIANLAEHGDNFCRPPRPFFGFGGRTPLPLLAPWATNAGR